MSDTDTDLGPIDYLVVEFPAGEQHFTGAMIDELTSLVDNGTVRVLDLVILGKADDGSVEVHEFEDLGDRDSLAAFEGQLAEVLALEDVELLAEVMEPGSVAGVLVWENTWAAPFAVAARESGGQLIASGRIPTQALVSAMQSANEED